MVLNIPMPQQISHVIAQICLSSNLSSCHHTYPHATTHIHMPPHIFLGHCICMVKYHFFQGTDMRTILLEVITVLPEEVRKLILNKASMGFLTP